MTLGILGRIGAAIGAFIRGPERPPAPNRHWFPKNWNPERLHTCYYCGIYDQEEREVTRPPCPATRRIGL